VSETPERIRLTKAELLSRLRSAIGEKAAQHDTLVRLHNQLEKHNATVEAQSKRLSESNDLAKSLQDLLDRAHIQIMANNGQIQQLEERLRAKEQDYQTVLQNSARDIEQLQDNLALKVNGNKRLLKQLTDTQDRHAKVVQELTEGWMQERDAKHMFLCALLGMTAATVLAVLRIGGVW
jgi:uncharacterized phage infection (PIP) family protein YhgE